MYKARVYLIPKKKVPYIPHKGKPRIEYKIVREEPYEFSDIVDLDEIPAIGQIIEYKTSFFGGERVFSLGEVEKIEKDENHEDFLNVWLINTSPPEEPSQFDEAKIRVSLLNCQKKKAEEHARLMEESNKVWHKRFAECSEWKDYIMSTSWFKVGEMLGLVKKMEEFKND